MKMVTQSRLSMPCAKEVVSHQAGAFGQKLSAARRIQYQASNVNHGLGVGVQQLVPTT